MPDTAYKLSDALYALPAEGDGVVLYTSTAENVERADPDAAKLVLTSEEQVQLVEYLTDGCCPVCWDPINLGQVVCASCFKTARRYFEGYGL